MKTILEELMDNQLAKIPLKYKLDYLDMKRISEHLTISPFNNPDCCVWITNYRKDASRETINFTLNKHKCTFVRIFYMNFTGALYKNNYLKYRTICKHQKTCINPLHIQKNHFNVSLKEKKIRVTVISHRRLSGPVDSIILSFD